MLNAVHSFTNTHRDRILSFAFDLETQIFAKMLVSNFLDFLGIKTSKKTQKEMYVILLIFLPWLSWTPVKLWSNISERHKHMTVGNNKWIFCAKLLQLWNVKSVTSYPVKSGILTWNKYTNVNKRYSKIKSFGKFRWSFSITFGRHSKLYMTSLNTFPLCAASIQPFAQSVRPDAICWGRILR